MTTESTTLEASQKRSVNLTLFSAVERLPFGSLSCLLGWPQSGKTLLAKTIAAECGCDFVSCSWTELNGAIGDAGERRVVIEVDDFARHIPKTLSIPPNVSLFVVATRWTDVSPVVRPHVEFVFFCGALPNRDIAAVYHTFAHYLPMNEDLFTSVARNTLHDFRRLVLDVSFRRRVRRAGGEVCWLAPIQCESCSRSAEAAERAEQSAPE